MTRVAELEAAVGVEGLSGAERDLGRFDAAVTGTTRNITSRIASMGPTLERTGKSLTKFVTLPLAVGFGLALREADQAEKVARQSVAVLKSTGNVAGVTAGEMEKLATSISKKTAIDDEQIQSAENMLLTFKKITNAGPDKIFDRTTRAIVDTAAGFAALHGTEVDVSSATIQIGKALNDPIKGLTALTRVGIQFTQQQKDQIAFMVLAGDTAGAQKIILRELESQFKGSGEAGATGFAHFKVELQNFAEEAGTKAMPIARRFLDVASDLLDTFLAMPDWAQDIALGGAAAGMALGPVLRLGGGIANMVGGIGKMSGPGGVSSLVSKLGGAGGLALTAGVAGLGVWALSEAIGAAGERERVNRQHVSDMTDAIATQGGKVKEATAAWVENTLVKELQGMGGDFITKMTMQGKTIDDMTAAMRRGPQAAQDFVQGIFGVTNSIDLIKAGGAGFANVLRDAAGAMRKGTVDSFNMALQLGHTKDAMQILKDVGAGPLRDRLLEINRSFKANVEADTSQAKSAVLELLGIIDRVAAPREVTIDRNPFLPGIQTAASGGPRSGFTLVGEEGPELVNLPSGSFVHTAAESRGFLMPPASGAPGGPPVTTVHNNVIIVRDGDEAIRELSRLVGPDPAHRIRHLSGMHL